MQPLGDLTGGSFSSTAYDVSADGSIVVGGSYSASGYEAFRWTGDAGMQGIGDLSGGSFGSVAHAISGDGSTIVGQGTTNFTHEVFRWTSDAGMQTLNVVQNQGAAVDVSRDGSMLIGYRFNPLLTLESFSWTAKGGLESLSGSGTDKIPAAMSADGSIIVGHFDNYGTMWPWIWDAPNGMRMLQDVLVSDYGLDLTGWTLQQATGISDDGLTIVGYGRNPAGYAEGWIAVIPEPQTFSVMLLVSATIPPRKRAMI
jgi:probable HAF family extracellular repeat protein